MNLAVRSFLAQLGRKLHRDDAFFMAAGLAWGALFAVVPLVTLCIGLTGFVLSARFDDPTEAVVAVFSRVLPSGGAELDFPALLESVVGEVMTNRAGITIVGTVIFVGFAVSLAGHLRNSLARVFEIDDRRSFLRGLGFDVGAVVLGVAFVTVNLGITILLTAVVHFGVEIVGFGPHTVTLADRLLVNVIALTSIWMLYFLIYRFFPAKGRVVLRDAVLAATVAAMAHEGLKRAFSWYVTSVADYQSTLGNLATVVALLLWIYWGALVFILGGEIAYVYHRRHGTDEGVLE